MSKVLKLKNENYLDSSSIVYKKSILEKVLDSIKNGVEEILNKVEKIEAEGESNGIHYIKYTSGKLIQYGTWKDIVSTTSAYYQVGYRTDEYAFGGKKYPVAFTNIENTQISSIPTQDNILIATIFKNDNKLINLPKIHYIFPYTVQDVTIINNFFVIGKWK